MRMSGCKSQVRLAKSDAVPSKALRVLTTIKVCSHTLWRESTSRLDGRLFVKCPGCCRLGDTQLGQGHGAGSGWWHRIRVRSHCGARGLGARLGLGLRARLGS